MNKIWLIIKREYLVRVRKRSFIVMTILGPILMASLIILPTYLTIQGKEERIIALNERGDFFSSRLVDTGNLHFVKIPEYEVGSIKEDLALEKRVSVTPETAKNIIGLGLKVCIEKDYASHLGINDNVLLELGFPSK